MSAAKNAAEAAKRIPIPPSSPFATLLRRSRFAAFDQKIRQTYSSPRAHAHRGDFGLKRPIPIRRKNAFITLTAPYEAREQFTEWVKGEAQVRFIRRFEEMDVNPDIAPTSPWYQTQPSSTVTEWLIDSEFSDDTERPQFKENRTRKELAALAAAESVKQQPAQDAQLSGLGNPEDMVMETKRLQSVLLMSGLSPNIDGMSEAKFKRFVRNLRKTRPAFRKFINESQPELEHKSLFALSQDESRGLHRRFLEQQTFDSFRESTSTKLEPLPHRVGGLVYHHPTHLHTHIFSRMEPGIYLQADSAKTHFHQLRSEPGAAASAGMMVSFGGLNVSMAKAPAGQEPLFDARSEEGMYRGEDLDEDVVDQMRIVPGSVTLSGVPRTVGPNASGVKGIRLRGMVTTEPAFHEDNMDVPFFPGTYDYSAFDVELEGADPDEDVVMPIKDFQEFVASVPEFDDHAEDQADDEEYRMTVDMSLEDAEKLNEDEFDEEFDDVPVKQGDVPQDPKETVNRLLGMIGPQPTAPLNDERKNALGMLGFFARNKAKAESKPEDGDENDKQ